MNADPQLHDRLRRAIEAYGLEADDARTALTNTVRLRQRHRRLAAMAVAAAIVGSFGLAGWLTLAGTTSPQPVDTPERYEPPSPPGGPQPATEIAPLPKGVHSNRPAQIKEYALTLIAQDEEALGRVLVPARIESIRYVAANDDPGLSWWTGINPYDSWVVEYEGTGLECGWWCTGHLGGTFFFSNYGPGQRSMYQHFDPTVCLVRDGGRLPQNEKEIPTC